MISIGIKFPVAIPALQTNRLILDPICQKDAENYFALCSNVEVMGPWGTPYHRSIQETRNLIDFLDSEFKLQHLIRWGIRERNNSKLIGDIGFWRFVRPRLRAEIGAKLDIPFWNCGYMTEAMAQVIQFGFQVMNLNSIEGNIDIGNKGSMRLVDKLGFEREGYLKEHSYCSYREKYVDTFLYSLRVSQWKLRPPSGGAEEQIGRMNA